MINLTVSRKNVTRRYSSNLIDYSIFFALTAAYVYAFGAPNDQGGYSVTGLKTLAEPLAWTLYFPMCESLWGQTLGKKVFDLHVVDLRGETPGFGSAFLRRILDIFELMTAGLLSIITISRSEKHQRVGDMLAGTVVVTSSSICRFCLADVQLTPKEVIRDTFICPSCQQPN
jgi:uncharacterized RDD family membrane protein YckC